MRKFTALIVSFILVLASALMAFKGYNVDYKKLNDNSFELNYNVGDFEISEKDINGTMFSKINFEGNITTNEKGYAALPYIHATVELLSNSDVTLKVVESDYVDYNLDFPLIPSRGTIYRNQDPTTIPILNCNNFNICVNSQNILFSIISKRIHINTSSSYISKNKRL